MNIEIYEKKLRSVYEDLAESVRIILEAAIEAHPTHLRLQLIKHRAKDSESLRKKLDKIGALESENIEELVKDLAGCRIVFYTNSDVSRFCHLALLEITSLLIGKGLKTTTQFLIRVASPNSSGRSTM